MFFCTDSYSLFHGSSKIALIIHLHTEQFAIYKFKKVISEPFQFCSMDSLERKFFKGVQRVYDGSHTESKRDLASHSGPDEKLITFIIHSKYFSDSDWQKALV